MQAVVEQEQRAGGIAISFETLAYAAVLILVLWMRLAQLGAVPISEAEVGDALAAWRALHPEFSGTQPVAQSPLLFALHSLAFMVFGGTEFGLRVFTALAGAGLVMSPLLFRRALGPGRAFVLSLILACSPVLLLASRFDSPVIWALWAALIGLWGLWRWSQVRSRAYALLSSAAVAALVFLTDPMGWVYALILLAAIMIARAWQRLDAPDEAESTETPPDSAGWPWQTAVLTGGLVILLVSTVFMTYLPGLSSVGALLERSLAGIMAQDFEAPPVFALTTSLFYEPWIWLFGLLGIWLLWRRGALSLLDRFLVAWAGLATLVPLFYRGTDPAHAIWIVVPLAGLASTLLIDLLGSEVHPYLAVPQWLKPVAVIVLLAILTVAAISMQAVARVFTQTQDGLLNNADLNPVGLLVVLMTVLLSAAAYLLVSSMWGAVLALRLGTLGLLLFGLLSSLGSGWNAAVTQADNAAEFWYVRVTTADTALLRETLLTLARRESDGFPHLPIYTQAADDDIVGWLLRDFTDVTYVQHPSEARAQGIALLAATTEPPDLRGSYVGQDFAIKRTWRMESMRGLDALSWWMQRRTRAGAVRAQSMVLWLRQDIYDGVEFDFVG